MPKTNIFNDNERNRITLIIIILLGLTLAYAVRGIIGSLLGTMVMYTLFRPMNIWMVERLKWNRPLSAIIIMIVSLVVVVLPLIGVGRMLFQKAMDLAANPEWINNIVNSVNEFAGDQLGKPDFLQEQLETSASFVGSILTGIASGAAGLFLDITVMYFLLYFMFVNFRGFERGLIRYSPFKLDNAVKFGHEMRNITYSNVVGQTIIAIIQGATLSIGFWIFGFPDAIFWGVICAILSFIPLLGPPLIFVPAAVIALMDGNMVGGIGLLVYGFVLVINIDNVLRLVIAKKLGDIHPIITVVGVIIGIPLFGVLGLVFGPLLLSYFLIAIKIYDMNMRGVEEPKSDDLLIDSPDEKETPPLNTAGD